MSCQLEALECRRLRSFAAFVEDGILVIEMDDGLVTAGYDMSVSVSGTTATVAGPSGSEGNGAYPNITGVNITGTTFGDTITVSGNCSQLRDWVGVRADVGNDTVITSGVSAGSVGI